MFTGLVEEIGEVVSIQKMTDGLKMVVEAKKILGDIRVDDSICIDGACQTVVSYNNTSFTVEAVGETLDKTTFKYFKPGSKVNLERSLTLQQRLGGHLVQGHINGTGKITKWQKRAENYLLEVQLVPDLMKYCIREGSIAINGISLTIATLSNTHVSINIIPHTVKSTNLHLVKNGDIANIEVDVIARYVEKFISPKAPGKLTETKLKEWGY